MHRGTSKVIVIIGAIVIGLSSCATIISGTDQAVAIDTEPAANISVRSDDGAVFFEGEAPATIDLPRKNAYTVEVSLDGYEDETVRINQSLNSWFIANIICGGIPGGAVDFITGAMWDLEPTQVNVTLESVQAMSGDVPMIVLRGVGEDGTPRVFYVPLIPSGA